MLWMEEAEIEVRSFSKYYIDVKIAAAIKGKTWRLTGFYGDPYTNKRQDSWDMLRRLGISSELPWLCVGAFNEILSEDEKLGGVI